MPSPKLTTGTADEYLHVLSRNNDIRQSFEGLALGFANSALLQVPTRRSVDLTVRRLHDEVSVIVDSTTGSIEVLRC